MGYKEVYVDALLGDGLDSDWLTREVGTIEELSDAADMEEAAIQIALFCKNYNNQVLKKFEGVKIFEILLRGGQRSSPLVSLALAALERMKSPVSP